MSRYPGCLDAIKAVITDVDGVLTDGGMYYSEAGEELKKFNVRDGAGVALLKHAGILVCGITGEDSEASRRRMHKLKFDGVYVGVRNKIKVMRLFMSGNDLTFANLLYVGDEINDLSAIGSVGCAACPADACQDVKEMADVVTGRRGGDGVLREVAERLLEGQGKYREALRSYLAAITDNQ